MKIKPLSVRRILALTVAIAIVLGSAAAQPALAKSDGKLNKALVSNVVKYEIDSDTGKWSKTEKTVFKYSKGYPKSISTYYYSSKSHNSNTFKYTFRDNGNPKKMYRYNDAGDKMETHSYMKNGSLRTISYNCDGIVWKETFQYGAGRFFTIKIHEETRSNVFDDPDDKEYADEIDYVTVTRKNGLLKKTVNRGIFANYDTVGTKKKWTDFMGTYTVHYDENGIVSNTYAKFKGPASYNTGKQLRFELKKKNGRIVKIMQYSWNSSLNNGKGAWKPETKYIFKYSKKKIDKVRFSNMINDLLMGENNYYAFTWY